MKKTNLERYGVEYVQTLSEVKEKQRQTNLKKYGTESSSQIHYSEETRNILFNKESFREFMVAKAQKDAYVAAKLLNVADTTIRNYIHYYGLEKELLYLTVSSIYEQELRDFLNSLHLNFSYCRKDIIPPLEIDIFLDDLNIGIEFDGNYWHSDKFKPISYHSIKTSECEKRGVRLIHIFEYEWDTNKEKIKNFLKRELLKSQLPLIKNGLYVKEIPYNLSKNFIQKYDIKEYQPSSIRIGLYSRDDLLEVITFSKTKTKLSYAYKIENYAMKEDLFVENGLQLLINYFEDHYNPKNIVLFLDRSKYLKDKYLDIGFRFEKISSIHYLWVDSCKNLTYTKYDYSTSFKKDNISNKSEDGYMKELGYLKIYDCGDFVLRKEFK